MSKALEAIEANAPLVKLIDQYITDREALGEFNGRTAEVTRSRLYLFAKAMRGIDPWEIERRHIKEWLASMPHVQNSTKATRYSSANSLFNWAIAEGILTHNPCTGVKRPKAKRGENRALTEAEVKKLELHIRLTSPKRGVLMFSLMYWEGLRAGEVAAIQLHDIDFAAGIIHVRGKGYRGKPSRQIVLSPDTTRALRRYLSGSKIEGGPVFRSQLKPDQGATARQISHRMSIYCRDAGIKHGPYDGVSGHALRHTAAEEMAAEADDLRTVSEFLGHQNFATTQTYLRNEVGGQAEAMKARANRGKPQSDVPEFFREAG